MKGRAEKELAPPDARAAALDLDGKLQALAGLYNGLRRSVRHYPALASIDWEIIENGKVLVLRMLYPYEMIRVEMSEPQVTDLCNRGLGLTPDGIQIASPEETALILGGGGGSSPPGPPGDLDPMRA